VLCLIGSVHGLDVFVEGCFERMIRKSASGIKDSEVCVLMRLTFI